MKRERISDTVNGKVDVDGAAFLCISGFSTVDATGTSLLTACETRSIRILAGVHGQAALALPWLLPVAVLVGSCGRSV